MNFSGMRAWRGYIQPQGKLIFQGKVKLSLGLMGVDESLTFHII